MGFWDRLRHRRRTSRRPKGRGPTTVRPSDSADEQHLSAFAGSRRGVEGFVEPRTAVSDITLMLVAHDGEWTRRRVPSVEWAHAFANKRGIPSYDAAVVGYPARMREYNRRQKAESARSTQSVQPAEPVRKAESAQSAEAETPES